MLTLSVLSRTSVSFGIKHTKCEEALQNNVAHAIKPAEAIGIGYVNKAIEPLKIAVKVALKPV